VSEDLTIPPPDPEREPLKVNVYEHARGLTCTLAPLFPHLHAGAIVPTVALFWGRPAGDYGYFEHYNTVDEVVIIFGADGAAGRARTGLVRVNANTHGVGKFLPDPDDPEVFSLICITQRQAETERQEEAVWFKCEQCQTDLARLDFDWQPAAADEIKDRHGTFAPLGTVVKSAQAAAAFNASDDARTCPNCGHVSPPFPLERWGWDRYAAQTTAVNRAQAALQAVAGSGPAEE
jgi:hypothetical protein